MADIARDRKAGDPSCSGCTITVPYAECLAPTAIAIRIGGILDGYDGNMRLTNYEEANQ